MASDLKNRTDRMASNAVFSLLAWMLPIFIGFFTTPILVHGLGNESYGLYTVITGFIAYSFSFGIGKIAAKYVAEYRATGEIEKISPVISATFAFSMAVGLLGTAILAATARFIVTDILLIEGPAVEVAVTSLYLACAISIAAMVSQIYQYILQGLQKFGVLLLLTNLNGVLLGAGNIIIVLGGGGIIAILLWNVSIAVVVGALFYVVAHRNLPQLNLTLKVESSTARAVLNYGTSIIFYQIFANVLFIFERALVMRKFGAEALAFYSVPMLLAIYLHSLVGSFAVVLFPVVNELLGDRKRQIELYQKASKIILAVVVFAVMTFACTGRPGLQVWINAEFSENSYALLIIHSLTFGAIAIAVIAWQIAEGFRHAKINAFITASWLAIAAPLMFFAADRYGLEGVAISRLLAVLLTLPVIAYVEKRFLGEIFWAFWGGLLIRITFATAFAAFVEIVIVRSFAPSWAMLAGAGTCGFFAFAAVLFITGYFTSAERMLLTRVLKGRFARTSAPTVENEKVD